MGGEREKLDGEDTRKTHSRVWNRGRKKGRRRGVATGEDCKGMGLGTGAWVWSLEARRDDQINAMHKIRPFPQVKSKIFEREREMFSPNRIGRIQSIVNDQFRLSNNEKEEKYSLVE